MHAIGATVVGVTAAVTGGTFNQVLLQQPVGWIRDSRLLAMLIAFCLAGFYLWPLADRFVERSRQSGGIASDLRPLFDSISPPGETNDSAAGHPVRYCLESVALGSAAVVAAQQGGDHHVAAGPETAVGPQHHAMTQLVQGQHLVHFRQAHFPGQVGIFD